MPVFLLADRVISDRNWHGFSRARSGRSGSSSGDELIDQNNDGENQEEMDQTTPDRDDERAQPIERRLNQVL